MDWRTGMIDLIKLEEALRLLEEGENAKAAALINDAIQGLRISRVFPHSIESEQSVLGSMMADEDAVHGIVEILRPEDFYAEAHRRIFRAMLALYERGEPLDAVSVAEELRRNGGLERAGGIAYLGRLAEKAALGSSAVQHAQIVREKASLRRLMLASGEIISRCARGRQSAEELFEYAEELLLRASSGIAKPSFHTPQQVLREAFAFIEKIMDRDEPVTGVPSGFRNLDRLTSGFQPSNLIIVAGRPSMGKTAFCLSVLRHASIRRRIPAIIFSLEMPRMQLMLRMLSSEAMVSLSDIRSGSLSDADLKRLVLAANAISCAPFLIDDTPALSVSELRARAKRLKKEIDLGLIIVDYLQLLRGKGPAERREQEISEISRALKSLARELEIPVIAVSQLSRRTEDRPGRRPQLADLRESGAIEQDADLVIFIYRDEVYNPESFKRGAAEVIIGKQRNGPTGVVELAYLSDFAAFKDLWAGDPVKNP